MKQQGVVQRIPLLVAVQLVVLLIASLTVVAAVPQAQADQPADSAQPVKAVDVGGETACVIEQSGALGCWGDLPLPPTGTFTQVSVGERSIGQEHACALRSDATVVCWDSGGVTERGGSFLQVSAGGQDCGIRTDRTLVCWGSHATGQGPPTSGAFSDVSVGLSHSCAVQTDGAVRCWGNNEQGEASPPPGAFKQVSAGIGHSCGVRLDGSVICWGTYSSEPVNGTYVQISTEFPRCGVRTDGLINCWLSDQVPPQGSHKHVSVGRDFGCALSVNGYVTCFGPAGSPTPVRYRRPYTITVDADSAGGDGVVTSSPAGLECRTDCTVSFPAGTTVTLTAQADASSSFHGWLCSGSNNRGGTCQLYMDRDHRVQAFFHKDALLSVTKEGAGGGTVKSNEGSIDCGSICSHSYDWGTKVTLTATPDASSVFVGWLAIPECAETVTCSLTVTRGTTVSARFDPRPKLTVTREGTGSGAVKDDLGRIDCGAQCEGLFSHNEAVTLTATPDPGSTFIGWGGACSGSGSCVVNMTEHRSVAAIFSPGENRTSATKSTFRYSRRTRTFKGTLDHDDAYPSCRVGRDVTLKKRRRGPDRVVGSDISGPDGRWSHRVSRRASGRFYLVVDERIDGSGDDQVLCTGFRSETIRI